MRRLLSCGAPLSRHSPSRWLSSSLSLSSSSPFLVLGIETSCDDTAAAVVRSDGEVLSNVVASQHQLHEAYGGVVPALALQAHKDRIDEVVEEAIAAANLSGPEELDGIAATRGPGLEICLRVGLHKAQDMARQYSKPFVPIHHLEAHCLISRIAAEEPNVAGLLLNRHPYMSCPDTRQVDEKNNLPHCQPKVNFPFLTFLASGGHTSLLLCRDIENYEIIGATIDDALGEALDKSARLLGLSTTFNGGGVAVEQAALRGKVTEDTRLTVPLLRQRNCDFSYSGLKNGFRMAVLKAREKVGVNVEASNAPSEPCVPVQEAVVTLPDDIAANLCAGFQEAAFQHAEDRLYRAIGYLEDYDIDDVKSLVICGGVAANAELRRRLLRVIDNVNSRSQDTEDTFIPWGTFIPPPKLCTDNGVMVAWAGVEHLCRFSSAKFSMSSDEQQMEPLPRWSVGPHVNIKNDVVFRKREKK